jgi:DNA primase large subunit
MKNLPKFVSRNRPDMKEYEKGNVNEAQDIKTKLEQKQRDKLKNFNFIPKYFEKKFNDIINEEVYIYNGKYYDDKINNIFNTKNDFQDNDIFNYN